ncbi:MAG: hypothetical protein HY725_01260 [Candidatus Rokubacteria bacterium]|nr:hypothetical protein [Candidatus Rokubacteria bacterium]
MSDYEELRRVATGRPPSAGHGVGFALFLRSGMAAWIEACAAVAPPCGAPRLPPMQRDQLLPTDMRGEVTMVLATMALSVAREGGLRT